MTHFSFRDLLNAATDCAVGGASAELDCRGFALAGIVNATPDSFSDGGLNLDPGAAARSARRLVEEGAAMIDVGAESTRPGFRPVEADEEMKRLMPVLEAVLAECPGTPVSVDTRKARVARLALAAGARIVNDQSALGDPEMADVVREAGAGLVLMHGWDVHVGAVVRTAAPGALGAWGSDGLARALDRALEAGVPEESICLDPGFGFGLRHGDNAEVLRALPEMVRRFSPIPMLVGPSRKHFLAAMYPESGGDADAATALFCAEAFAAGARIARVHAPGVVAEAMRRVRSSI